jgi:hypothetical protein
MTSGICNRDRKRSETTEKLDQLNDEGLFRCADKIDCLSCVSTSYRCRLLLTSHPWHVDTFEVRAPSSDLPPPSPYPGHAIHPFFSSAAIDSTWDRSPTLGTSTGSGLPRIDLHTTLEIRKDTPCTASVTCIGGRGSRPSPHSHVADTEEKPTRTALPRTTQLQERVSYPPHDNPCSFFLTWDISTALSSTDSRARSHKHATDGGSAQTGSSVSGGPAYVGGAPRTEQSHDTSIER